jgi:hypothetical protein
VALDTMQRLGDSGARPREWQLATMLRRFAAVDSCPHHIATVPTYETWGGHESRALQVTHSPGTSSPSSHSFTADGLRRVLPCGC